MKLILADTVGLMNSEDYRDRFVAEYIQTKIRYERLKDFNTKIEASVRTRGLDNGVDEPIHACPAGLLREQQAAMGEYLHHLEVRAKIEDIDLEDTIQNFSDKKRDRERMVIDETATVENANTVSFGEKEKEAFEQVVEEKREEIKFELSVCANCVHYPICRYLVGHFEKFKLPRGEQSCDLFMSADGCDEPCERDKDESDVTLK